MWYTRMEKRLVPTPVWYHYINISSCVCVCKWDVCGVGLDYWCMTSTLCTVCTWSQAYATGEYSSWSGHKHGAVAEADEIGERCWSWWKRGAVGSGHARLVLARDATAWGLLVHQGMGLHAVHQTHTDVVKEARLQRHTLSAAKRELLCTVLC